MRRRTILIGILAAAMVVGGLAPATALSAEKVYELTFAWNDIWGPKFRASQVYRPCGEMQRMVHERSNGRIKLHCRLSGSRPVARPDVDGPLHDHRA